MLYLETPFQWITHYHSLRIYVKYIYIKKKISIDRSLVPVILWNFKVLKILFTVINLGYKSFKVFFQWIFCLVFAILLCLNYDYFSSFSPVKLQVVCSVVYPKYWFFWHWKTSTSVIPQCDISLCCSWTCSVMPGGMQN